MPNHISNRLTITGDPSDVAKIFEEIANEDVVIDFSKIVPRPAIFDNTATGFNSFDGKEVRAWWTDTKLWNDPDRLPDRAFTDEETTELFVNGHGDWYSWNIAHWDTKWNAYDSHRIDDNSIYFETAWSAPIRVIAALACLHPEVIVRLEYADEDIGSNSGTYVSVKGTCVHRGLKGPDAARLWFDMNDADPVERGYDPETFEYKDAS